MLSPGRQYQNFVKLKNIQQVLKTWRVGDTFVGQNCSMGSTVKKTGLFSFHYTNNKDSGGKKFDNI